MNLLVVLIIILILFGGGGYYAGPAYHNFAFGGIGLGGLLLFILVIMLLTGRL